MATTTATCVSTMYPWRTDELARQIIQVIAFFCEMITNLSGWQRHTIYQQIDFLFDKAQLVTFESLRVIIRLQSNIARNRKVQPTNLVECR